MLTNRQKRRKQLNGDFSGGSSTKPKTNRFAQARQNKLQGAVTKQEEMTPTTPSSSAVSSMSPKSVITPKAYDQTKPEGPGNWNGAGPSMNNTPRIRPETDIAGADNVPQTDIASDIVPTPQTDIQQEPTVFEQQEQLENKLESLQDDEFALGQMKTMENYNRDKEYLDSQNALRGDIRESQDEIDNIQSTQRMRKARQQVDNLKQQVGFLGNMGNSAQSSVALSANESMIIEAEKTYDELVAVEKAAKAMKEAGVEYDAAQFERKMDDLQRDLDSQISKTVQEAYNNLNKLEAAGEITRTKKNVEEMKKSITDSLDLAVADYINATNTERSMIMQSYQKAVQFGREYIQNKNTVNQEMSAVQGFYVDGNGEPIVGANGQPVSLPVNPPMDPIFQDGKLITFDTGANGEIVTSVQQVLEEPEEKIGASVMIDIMKSINEGNISKESAKLIFPSLADAIEQQIVSPKNEIPKVQTIGTDEDGNDIKGYYDERTGGFVSIQGFNAGTNKEYTGPYIPPVEIENYQKSFDKFTSMQDGSQVRGGQCGEFVNDYLKDMGIPMNVFTDKIDIRKTQANSTEPTVGSIAIFDETNNPNASEAAKAYGHVAIVTKVNEDGTINVKEQNGKIKERVGTRENIKTDNITYFDPTIGLGGGQGAEKESMGNYEQSLLGAFDMVNFNKPTLQKQQKETIQKLLENGKTDAVRKKLINLTKEGMTSAESRKVFEASMTMSNSLEEIASILDELEAKGVDTGILSGKRENLANYFGKVGDPEITKLGRTLSDQLDALRRSRSGAALTEYEEEFYDTMFPSAGKSYNLNKSIVSGLKDSRDILIKSSVESIYGEEYANLLLEGEPKNKEASQKMADFSQKMLEQTQEIANQVEKISPKEIDFSSY